MAMLCDGEKLELLEYSKVNEVDGAGFTMFQSIKALLVPTELTVRSRMFPHGDEQISHRTFIRLVVNPFVLFDEVGRLDRLKIV